LALRRLLWNYYGIILHRSSSGILDKAHYFYSPESFFISAGNNCSIQQFGIMNENNYLIVLEKLLMEHGWQGPLREGLEKLLESTTEKMGYKRMSLAIFDPKTQSIEFSLYVGHSRTPKYTYTPGQGIIGQVVKEQSPMIVPLMKDDPNFLNLAFDRSSEELSSLSFISVPIKRQSQENETEILGVLNAEMELRDLTELETNCRFLQVLGMFIARQTSFLQEEVSRQKEQPQFTPAELNIARQSMTQNKLISSSKAMNQIMNQIMQVAASRATVLIRGESGTGKELLAEAIHNLSPRKDKPFIKLNCASLPNELLESELFGYERGAFTGAMGQKKGRFELAHQGTLFLDEVGELSAEAQAKLLRAVQEGEIERLGGEKTTRVNVRVLSAPLTSLWKISLNRAVSGRIYITGSMSFPFSSRPCANAAKTSCLWPIISCSCSAGNMKKT